MQEVGDHEIYIAKIGPSHPIIYSIAITLSFAA